MNDLERAVVEAAVKWADNFSVTKPSSPAEHNLWAAVGRLSAATPEPAPSLPREEP